MPVIFQMKDIPERILYAFLKAAIVLPNETLEIVPLHKWFVFLTAPDDGFIITSSRLVIYETRVLAGRCVYAEIPLQQLAQYRYRKAAGYYEFTFINTEGSQYTVNMKCTAQECEQIIARLHQLLSQ